MKTLLLFLCFLVISMVAIFLSNRWSRPRFGIVPMINNQEKPNISDEFSIVTWNIGYAALGARADFMVDGGEHLRVLNRDEIKAAAEFIGDSLQAFGADILLLQETAGASFLTRGVNVTNTVGARLSDYAKCFWSDFSTVLVPPPLRIKHGMSLYTKHAVEKCEILNLPQDPSYYYGFLKKYYAGIVVRHPIEGTGKSWVIVNIHLSAFDDGANVRRSQIKALLEFASEEFQRGNHVVIGGDWNMRISPKEFEHRTDPKHLFWVYDFPMEMLPKGWHFAVDEGVPTVRTLQKQYDAGDNFTMIIDGFLISPNVQLEEVRGVDYQFEFTDHQPVIARFSIKP